MGGVVVPPILYFNSRSRTGSDLFLSLLDNSSRISIHAPAQGATKSWRTTYMNLTISIHAPAQGATNRCYIMQKSIIISIHAPAQGAT